MRGDRPFGRIQCWVLAHGYACTVCLFGSWLCLHSMPVWLMAMPAWYACLAHGYVCMVCLFGSWLCLHGMPVWLMAMPAWYVCLAHGYACVCLTFSREIIIIGNFCIALFSRVHKLTALYNTLQHFLSESKIAEGNKVHESNTYITTNNVYIYTKI